MPGGAAVTQQQQAPGAAEQTISSGGTAVAEVELPNRLRRGLQLVVSYVDDSWPLLIRLVTKVLVVGLGSTERSLALPAVVVIPLHRRYTGGVGD